MNLIEFLFPKKCFECGKVGNYLCSSCRQTITKPKYQVCIACLNPSLIGKTHNHCKKRYQLDGVIFGYPYQGAIRKAIKKIKYQGVHSITEEITRISLERFEREQFLDYLAVPVPLYKKRLKQRGFNQAATIAKIVSKEWELEYSDDVLERIINTKPQSDLVKKDRITNIKKAFRLKDNYSIEGRDIFLIDDIFTTGSTLQECTRVLKKAGAGAVWGFVIAHGN